MIWKKFTWLDNFTVIKIWESQCELEWDWIIRSSRPYLIQCTTVTRISIPTCCWEDIKLNPTVDRAVLIFSLNCNSSPAPHGHHLTLSCNNQYYDILTCSGSINWPINWQTDGSSCFLINKWLPSDNEATPLTWPSERVRHLVLVCNINTTYVPTAHWSQSVPAQWVLHVIQLSSRLYSPES